MKHIKVFKNSTVKFGGVIVGIKMLKNCHKAWDSNPVIEQRIQGIPF